MSIAAIAHVQLAMPPGQEDIARAFYGGVLEMKETPKPEPLRSRGGVWFAAGSAQIHLGVEEDFRPARKAHTALLVEGLAQLAERLQGASYQVITDTFLPGYDRFYVSDPFGNRLEFMQQAH